MTLPILLSFTEAELRDLASGYSDGCAHIFEPSDTQRAIEAKLAQALDVVTPGV